jgi:hypothetical protein
MHFAPHAFHYFNCGNLLHIQVDHVEPRTEDQAEQVQCMFGDSQASSYEDTNNFIGSRKAPVDLTNALVFYFEALIYVLLDCALSLYELYDVIVTLRPTFLITLVILSLGGSSLAHAMLR